MGNQWRETIPLQKEVRYHPTTYWKDQQNLTNQANLFENQITPKPIRSKQNIIYWNKKFPDKPTPREGPTRDTWALSGQETPMKDREIRQDSSLRKDHRIDKSLRKDQRTWIEQGNHKRRRERVSPVPEKNPSKTLADVACCEETCFNLLI